MRHNSAARFRTFVWAICACRMARSPTQPHRYNCICHCSCSWTDFARFGAIAPLFANRHASVIVQGHQFTARPGTDRGQQLLLLWHHRVRGFPTAILIVSQAMILGSRTDTQCPCDSRGLSGLRHRHSIMPPSPFFHVFRMMVSKAYALMRLFSFCWEFGTLSHERLELPVPVLYSI